MAFPDSLDAFSTKVDGVDDVMAEHVNSLQTSVVNIQTLLLQRYERNLIPNSLIHDLWPGGFTFNDVADNTAIANGWRILTNGTEPDLVALSGASPTSAYPRRLRFTFDTTNCQLGLVAYLSSRDTTALRGKVVSVSVAALAEQAMNLRLGVAVWTGTADAYTTDIVGTWGTGNPTLASSWAYIGTPASIVVQNGGDALIRIANENLTVPTTAINLAVFIWTPDLQTTSDRFYLAAAQLEIGVKATNFAPRSYQEEANRVTGGPLLADGRLSLVTANPAPTGDTTAATTVYYVPYKGNRLSLYIGSEWVTRTFQELSLTVPSTVYRLFDIFAYDNAGTITLEALSWTQATGISAISGATNATPIVITANGHGLSNGDLVAIASVGGNTAANGIWSIDNIAANTFELAGSTGSGAYTSGGSWYKLNQTRATALTTQDGRYVKSGDPTRLYLGTGMTTGTSGQIEDSSTRRFLWNYYNRLIARFVITDSTSHTYTSATTRVYRNLNTNKIDLVMGVSEESILTTLQMEFNFDTGDGESSAGVGLNNSGTATSLLNRVTDVFHGRYLTNLSNVLAVEGYNFMQMTEAGAATSPDFLRAILRGQFLG